MSGLERFVEAQETVIETVLAELYLGQKRSHWMWFIFPQLAALGRSERANYYGLADLAEAEAYLTHPVLGPRLIECVKAAMAGYPKSAHQIFGSPDDMKFRSCLTLFMQAKGSADLFRHTLEAFYDGPDPKTLELIPRR